MQKSNCVIYPKNWMEALNWWVLVSDYPLKAALELKPIETPVDRILRCTKVMPRNGSGSRGSAPFYLIEYQSRLVEEVRVHERPTNLGGHPIVEKDQKTLALEHIRRLGPKWFLRSLSLAYFATLMAFAIVTIQVIKPLLLNAIANGLFVSAVCDPDCARKLGMVHIAVFQTLAVTLFLPLLIPVLYRLLKKRITYGAQLRCLKVEAICLLLVTVPVAAMTASNLGSKRAVSAYVEVVKRSLGVESGRSPAQTK